MKENYKKYPNMGNTEQYSQKNRENMPHNLVQMPLPRNAVLAGEAA